VEEAIRRNAGIRRSRLKPLIRWGGGAEFVAMFQVIFNAISASEMAALPVELQMELLAEFQMSGDLDPSRFGLVSRDGKNLHRYRTKDHRIYFERLEDRLIVHRVLHKNTVRDFLFRSKLPLPEEDKELGKHGGFWKLIEEGERSGKA
jgi:plasmid stabilization system protein ParE